MTDDESDRFIRNMQKDKDDSTLLIALTFILDILGLILILVGMIWALPAVWGFNTGAGLAYSGLVMAVLAHFLKKL